MRQALEALDWCDNALMEGTAIQLANRSAAAALRQAIEQAEFDAQSELDDQNRTPPTAPAQPNHDHLAESYQQGWQAGNKAAPAQPGSV
jgi:hypothetical protein